MTANEYLYSDIITLVAGQIILVTLFCKILSIFWRDENAKIGVFLGELAVCVVYVMTDDAMPAMGFVITSLIYIMTIDFVIKLIIMIMSLPATFRHNRLVSRCKRVCEQNRQLLSAEDICRICQAYCRQIKQKNNP